MRIIGALIVGALSLAATNPPIPTLEQMEADPSYTRVESRVIEGKCIPMAPLADIIRKNDNVKTVREVKCVQMLFTPPPSSDSIKTPHAEKALIAFIDPKRKSGTYFRGNWNDGDFDLTSISFDQSEWHDVSNGRARFFQNENDNSLMIVVFAAFENGETQGVAFAMESK